MATGYWPPNVEFDLEDLATIQLVSRQANNAR